MSNVKIISEHNRVRLVQLKEVKLPNFSHQFNFLNICINRVWIGSAVWQVLTAFASSPKESTNQIVHTLHVLDVSINQY